MSQRDEAERTAILKLRKPPEPSIRQFRTELTPEGEQFIIPGCEKDQAPGRRQLDLF